MTEPRISSSGLFRAGMRMKLGPDQNSTQNLNEANLGRLMDQMRAKYGQNAKFELRLIHKRDGTYLEALRQNTHTLTKNAHYRDGSQALETRDRRREAAVQLLLNKGLITPQQAGLQAGESVEARFARGQDRGAAMAALADEVMNRYGQGSPVRAQPMQPPVMVQDRASAHVPLIQRSGVEEISQAPDVRASVNQAPKNQAPMNQAPMNQASMHQASMHQASTPESPSSQSPLVQSQSNHPSLVQDDSRPSSVVQSLRHSTLAVSERSQSQVWPELDVELEPSPVRTMSDAQRNLKDLCKPDTSPASRDALAHSLVRAFVDGNLNGGECDALAMDIRRGVLTLPEADRRALAMSLRLLAATVEGFGDRLSPDRALADSRNPVALETAEDLKRALKRMDCLEAGSVEDSDPLKLLIKNRLTFDREVQEGLRRMVDPSKLVVLDPGAQIALEDAVPQFGKFAQLHFADASEKRPVAYPLMVRNGGHWVSIIAHRNEQGGVAFSAVDTDVPPGAGKGDWMNLARALLQNPGQADVDWRAITLDIQSEGKLGNGCGPLTVDLLQTLAESFDTGAPVGDAIDSWAQAMQSGLQDDKQQATWRVMALRGGLFDAVTQQVAQPDTKVEDGAVLAPLQNMYDPPARLNSNPSDASAHSSARLSERSLDSSSGDDLNPRNAMLEPPVGSARPSLQGLDQPEVDEDVPVVVEFDPMIEEAADGSVSGYERPQHRAMIGSGFIGSLENSVAADDDLPIQVESVDDVEIERSFRRNDQSMYSESDELNAGFDLERQSQRLSDKLDESGLLDGSRGGGDDYDAFLIGEGSPVKPR